MAIFKDVPTQQELWKMFNYHSNGYFIWKIKPANNTNIGDRAGCVSPDGYTRIMVNGVNYFAHRLIYTFFNGNFAKNLKIDHADDNPRNNRIENLQTVTNRENIQKKRKQSNNTSGLVGVHYMKDPQRKSHWHGYYVDESEKRISKFFNNKFAAYHFYCENSARVMGKFYKEKQLSTEDRHGYFDWLIEQTDKQNQDIFQLAA